MIAKSGPETDGEVVAMCLASRGPRHSQYTKESEGCDHWRSGHHGSVDAPPNYGEHSRALYQAEEGS